MKGASVFNLSLDLVVSLPVRGFGGRQADRGRRDLHEAAEVHHRGAEGAAAPRPQAGGLPLGHRAAQGVQAAGVAGTDGVHNSQ